MTEFIITVLVLLLAVALWGWYDARRTERARVASDEAAALGALLAPIVASDEAALSAGALPSTGEVHLTRMVYSRGGALRVLGLEDDETVGTQIGHRSTPEFARAAARAVAHGQAAMTTAYPDATGVMRTYRCVIVRSDDEAARRYYRVRPGDILLVWFWVDATEISRATEATVIARILDRHASR